MLSSLWFQSNRSYHGGGRHKTVAETEDWLNTFLQSNQQHEPMWDIPQPN